MVSSVYLFCPLIMGLYLVFAKRIRMEAIVIWQLELHGYFVLANNLLNIIIIGFWDVILL